MIRITGGKFKQKKLASINDFVRPTSSLKREAFFSIIESYAIKNSIELYKNQIFLDLFAGIGTMGLEAISRGMSEVIFFENNIEVINILRKNSRNIYGWRHYICKREKKQFLRIKTITESKWIYCSCRPL